MRISQFFLLLLLSTVSQTPYAQNQEQSPISNREQCKQQGGVWRNAGMANQAVCDIATKDAGKLCSDSSECESVCVVVGATPNSRFGQAVQGHCYQSRQLLGTCLARVTKGIAEPVMCID